MSFVEKNDAKIPDGDTICNWRGLQLTDTMTSNAFPKINWCESQARAVLDWFSKSATSAIVDDDLLNI